LKTTVVFPVPIDLFSALMGNHRAEESPSGKPVGAAYR